LSLAKNLFGGRSGNNSPSSRLASHSVKVGNSMTVCSQGFITPDISKVPWGAGFMIPIASRIKKELGIRTAVKLGVENAAEILPFNMLVP